jgi:hypothetical protein
VARTAEGFEELAVDGRDDIGGLDVDAAIVEHLRTGEPEWDRLTNPETVTDRRAQRQLWDDVRIAKERLSRTQSADLVVPLLNTEVRLTRDELEKLARPVLDQTVQVTRRLLRWAELPEGRLAGVFLVGGASRIPLVATLLHRELGEAPVVIEQPELVVAEGSLFADAALLATGAAAPGPTAELRLVFERRAENETVVGGHPLQEPHLVRASPVSTGTPATPGGPSGPLATAGATPAGALEDQETVRSRPDGSPVPLPAVDPWPHAAQDWTPDPEATVASEPSWRIESHRAPGGRTASPAAPTRPISPPAPTPPARSVSAGHPVSPAQPATARPSPARPAPSRPAPSRPPPPSGRTRRRSRGFTRFLQVLLSLIVMIAAPVAALVVAYSYSTGASLPDSAVQVAGELRDLIARLNI